MAALLLIDCQQSFIKGRWMSYIGEAEIAPIKKAFDNAAVLLPKLRPQVEILSSQCPFPKAFDFILHPPVAETLSQRDHVTRVIKPENNILDAVGAMEWLEMIHEKGIKTLVVGGCTLTSCVRVSAIEAAKLQHLQGLQVCVDLHLCGARASNYIKRCSACMKVYMSGYSESAACSRCNDGSESTASPVDKAIDDMRSANVQVYDAFDWSNFIIT